jgi:hypothetical protein
MLSRSFASPGDPPPGVLDPHPFLLREQVDLVQNDDVRFRPPTGAWRASLPTTLGVGL